MSEMLPVVPEPFQAAYYYIKRLEQYERYIGAFIFGSLARGEATEHSDLDIKAAIKEDNPCSNINHPVINGVKLDITFNSLQQLKTFTGDEIERRERVCHPECWFFRICRAGYVGSSQLFLAFLLDALSSAPSVAFLPDFSHGSVFTHPRNWSIISRVVRW